MHFKHIELKNVTIDIPIFDSNRSLRKVLYNQCVGKLGGNIHQSANKQVYVRALDNINLSVKEGDRLGLIGHNGAGKTTLLNVLAGIYKPHKGVVSISGKVTPLFNPSLGLDPDDTGYENIFTIGMFYGLSKKDVEKKTEEIIEFSELGDFIHSPARTYSSGMLLRLTFAVITSLNPDILIMDEEIGAGDASFASKASSRLKSFYDRISILVLASHSNELIRKMCNKVIMLEHGKIIKSGPTEEVIDFYQDRLNLETA